jgi:transcriptional regulator
MYVPPLHKEDRIDLLHDAIRRTGLATLVTVTQDGLIASHVPMLLDADPAPYGTLVGHLARPNPQARGAIG